jgi:uncharacterized membrane protein YuzA (DUF378 family)
MKALHTVAFILVVVGGLNWGLVGAGGWNLVEMLLGSWVWLERLVYVLVGLSALQLVFTHKKSCKDCCGSDAPAQM